MAPSPFLLNLLSPPSTYSSSSLSLYFFITQPHTHSPNRFRALKFRLYSSYHTIQIDTQQVNPTKKKRKPRPSFLEKIHDRWSLKPTSLREKFPWQEQEQEREAIEEVAEQRAAIDEVAEQREAIEEVAEQRELSSDVVGSESETHNNPAVREPVSSGSEKCVISAPWVDGNKPGKTQFDSEARSLQKSGEKSKKVNGSREHCESTILSSVAGQESKNLRREVTDNGNCKERVAEVDATPTRLSEGKEMLAVEGDKGISFNCNSSSIGQEFPNSKGSTRLPWEGRSEKETVLGDGLKKSNTNLAEKLIPEHELKRLRNVALRMVERIKVGAAGVTQAIVDSIHEKWKEDKVVKLKFEGPPAMNMKRTHEILESRTGGLVIWRSGGSVVLFRGMTYKLDCVQSYAKQNQANMNTPQSSRDLVSDVSWKSSTTEPSITYSSRYLDDLSAEELMDLTELNLLLDELGPRFKNWSGRDPLPIDADLLPSIIPGYKRPFRLLPYRIRHGLRDKEMSFLRRTARTMPPHFALGRNRELQGLAMTMVKLWERSAIAKIAIKRGVQNTCNERMAEELKKLTGGTLLSRNKDYIVFYRGNDFLPPVVTKELVEAQKLAALQQDEEEQAREKSSTLIIPNARAANGPVVAGTLAETMAATSRWGDQPTMEDMEKMMRDSALARHASLVRYLEKKLALAKGKVKKAEKALSKVQEYLEPADLPTDLETLSDEERFLFRKIGLSMKPYLLLGRRGIFDGTVENMHLHWKYRELVKIIVKRKSFSQVKHIAISLEAESGGVLISLDKTVKGYAIIVYRGKNYQQPSAIRPKNLLTRRQALARSIELQRREALKHHISELQEKIEKLKSELEDMKNVKEIDEETLYSRLDDMEIDPDGDDDNDDDMDEDEDEEAYLETYDSGNEDGYA